MKSDVVVNRESFLAALEPLLAFLKQKSLVDDQVGQVSYTNGRFFCKTEDSKMTTPAPDDLPVSFQPFATSGEDLVRYLQRMKNEDFTLSFEGESQLVVSSKKSKASFICTPGFEFSFPNKWKKIGPDLSESFSEVSKYAAKNFYKPALTGVHIQGKRMEACDSYQLLRLEQDMPFFEENVLAPASFSSVLSLVKPTKYLLKDNLLYLKNAKGIVCVCSVLGGAFPSMDKLESDQKTGVEVSFSSSAADAVERCSVFTDRLKFEEEKILKVSFKGGKAYFSVSSFVGTSKESVQVKYPESIEGLSFSVRPSLLIDCLKRSQKMLVGKRAVHIKSEGSWFVSALIG